MVAFIQGRNLEIYSKQTFKTSQCNESRHSICRLKSEQNYLEKEVPEKGKFLGRCFKTTGIIYLNVETWLLFAPPIKLSGYAPA